MDSTGNFDATNLTHEGRKISRVTTIAEGGGTEF